MGDGFAAQGIWESITRKFDADDFYGDEDPRIKYVRLQVRESHEEHILSHVKLEFLNGSMACSCGQIRGRLPDLRREPPRLDPRMEISDRFDPR